MSTQDAPPVNALVDLLPAGRDEWLASRVEDVLDAGLVVSAPSDPRGFDVVVPEGTAVRVFWRAPRGPAELATVVAEVRAGRLASWTLRPTAAATPATRREFFRVVMTAAVELRRDDGVGAGTLLDLSEGGMRCHVRQGGGLHIGDRVDAYIDFADESVALEAEVVRRRVHDLGVEVSVRFIDVSRLEGDIIRRHLFYEQRVRRSRGLT